MNVNESYKEYALGLLSYLSVLCRISFPFFHRLIAGGEARGLHSRVTSLPERAFSKALNGLLEKLGGEAVWVEQRKDMRLNAVGNLNVYCDWLFFRFQWEQLKISAWTQQKCLLGSPACPSYVYTHRLLLCLQLAEVAAIIYVHCHISSGIILTPKSQHMYQDSIEFFRWKSSKLCK